MCGIAGFFGKNSLPRNLVQASELISHRGPDDEGIEKVTLFDQLGTKHAFEAVHRRLALVDLTPSGAQPFKDEKGRILVFNGEIFNWKVLRKELEKAGYAFYSNCDTEVIIKGFDYWQFDLFNKLDGFWGFALFDTQTKKLILSRDRLGIKPLYYICLNSNGFYFSSEIRSLLALASRKPIIKQQKTLQFLANGFLEDDGETIYEGVNEFPLASYAVINLNQNISFSKYWQASSSVEIYQEEQAVDEFSEILDHSIESWLQADVPVSLALSGGIDSSVLAVAASKVKNQDITAFTSHFPHFPDIDEFPLAQDLAKKLSINLVPVQPSLDGIFKKMAVLAKHQEMPFTSFSQLIAWEVFGEISSYGFKAYVTGQGGDELFLGYKRYLVAYILEHYLDSVPRFKSSYYANNFSLNMFLKYLIYFTNTSLRKARTIKRMKKVIKPEFLKNNLDFKIQKLPLDLKSLQSYETFGVAQLKRLLRYDDRSASSFGLEGRPVFLNHKMVEFAVKLSPELLIKNGWPKFILRKYLDRHGFADIAWNKKKYGFEAPNSLWSKSWLRENWNLVQKQKTIDNFVIENLMIEFIKKWLYH